MVIHDRDADYFTMMPNETKTPLIIKSYTHLAFTISLEGFQMIAGRIAQIVNSQSSVKLAQFS
jgi:hypothetical protein